MLQIPTTQQHYRNQIKQVQTVVLVFKSTIAGETDT